MLSFFSICALLFFAVFYSYRVPFFKISVDSNFLSLLSVSASRGLLCTRPGKPTPLRPQIPELTGCTAWHLSIHDWELSRVNAKFKPGNPVRGTVFVFPQFWSSLSCSLQMGDKIFKHGTLDGLVLRHYCECWGLSKNRGYQYCLHKLHKMVPYQAKIANNLSSRLSCEA